MKRVICGFTLYVAAILLLSFSCLVMAESAEKIVTAAEVNGIWESRNGTFKVLALGKQKLKVEFSGIYKYMSPNGPMANTGEGSGIAHIKGDTAIFKPEDSDEDCKITMRFTDGNLVVGQVGLCGFGLNVTANGTYRKTDNRRHKFEK